MPTTGRPGSCRWCSSLSTTQPRPDPRHRLYAILRRPRPPPDPALLHPGPVPAGSGEAAAHLMVSVTAEVLALLQTGAIRSSAPPGGAVDVQLCGKPERCCWTRPSRPGSEGAKTKTLTGCKFMLIEAWCPLIKLSGLMQSNAQAQSAGCI